MAGLYKSTFSTVQFKDKSNKNRGEKIDALMLMALMEIEHM